MNRVGALNKTIEQWRKTSVKNEYGEYIDQWAKVRDIKAYVYAASGKEVVTNDEVFDTINLKVSIRNQVDIIEQDRVKYNGNMYLINFIQPDLSDRWLTLQLTRINE